MNVRIAWLALAFISFPLDASQTEQVKGTATYLQRMALPPNAVFNVHVEDVSRADASAETIGSVRIIGPGNPPIAFAIDIDPQRVDERHRYSVMMVSVEGHMKMLPTMEGTDRQPTLVVNRFIGVWPGETCGARFATSDLQNTYWKIGKTNNFNGLILRRFPRFIMRIKTLIEFY